jgi:hypothetical protein
MQPGEKQIIAMQKIPEKSGARCSATSARRG